MDCDKLATMVAAFAAADMNFERGDIPAHVPPSEDMAMLDEGPQTTPHTPDMESNAMTLELTGRPMSPPLPTPVPLESSSADTVTQRERRRPKQADADYVSPVSQRPRPRPRRGRGKTSTKTAAARGKA